MWQRRQMQFKVEGALLSGEIQRPMLAKELLEAEAKKRQVSPVGLVFVDGRLVAANALLPARLGACIEVWFEPPSQEAQPDRKRTHDLIEAGLGEDCQLPLKVALHCIGQAKVQVHRQQAGQEPALQAHQRGLEESRSQSLGPDLQTDQGPSKPGSRDASQASRLQGVMQPPPLPIAQASQVQAQVPRSQAGQVQFPCGGEAGATCQSIDSGLQCQPRSQAGQAQAQEPGLNVCDSPAPPQSQLGLQPEISFACMGSAKAHFQVGILIGSDTLRVGVPTGMSTGELVQRLGLGGEVRHLVSQQRVTFRSSLMPGDVLDARAKYSFAPDRVSIGDTSVYGAVQKLVSGHLRVGSLSRQEPSLVL